MPTFICNEVSTILKATRFLTDYSFSDHLDRLGVFTSRWFNAPFVILKLLSDFFHLKTEPRFFSIMPSLTGVLLLCSLEGFQLFISKPLLYFGRSSALHRPEFAHEQVKCPL
jgi:hypothetical protein